MQSMSKRCSIFENRLYSCIHLQWLTTIRHMGQWKPVSFIFRSGFRVRCAHFDSFHALQLVATILVCIIVSWQYARLRLPTTFGNFVQGKRSNYCLIRWLHAKWIRFGWFLGIHRCRVYGFKYQQKTWIVHSFIGSIQLQEAVKSSDGNNVPGTFRLIYLVLVHPLKQSYENRKWIFTNEKTEKHCIAQNNAFVNRISCFSSLHVYTTSVFCVCVKCVLIFGLHTIWLNEIRVVIFVDKKPSRILSHLASVNLLSFHLRSGYTQNTHKIR